MTEKMLALLAFATLTGFLGILVAYVPRWDLGLICGLTLALAGYDLYSSNFRK